MQTNDWSQSKHEKIPFKDTKCQNSTKWKIDKEQETRWIKWEGSASIFHDINITTKEKWTTSIDETA